MKKGYILIIVFLAFVSCKNTDQQAKNQQENAQEIALPPLEKGEEVVYEDTLRRVVSLFYYVEDEQNSGYTTIVKVQAKKEGIHSFNLQEDFLTVQLVDEHFIFVSEGDFSMQNLMVYNIETGEKLIHIDQFYGEIASEKEGEYYFYIDKDDAIPDIRWEGDKRKWTPQGEIPAKYLNESLKDIIRVLEDSGEPFTCSLMVLEKHRLDTKNKKIIPLEEYIWVIRE